MTLQNRKTSRQIREYNIKHNRLQQYQNELRLLEIKNRQLIKSDAPLPLSVSSRMTFLNRKISRMS